MKKKYDDMLDMPRHVSDRHPKMNRVARAAQFAPFAALSGFEELVIEEARVTEEKIELAEEEKLRISELITRATASDRPYQISITYFVEDKYKKGGSYVTRVGIPMSFDPIRRILTMQDGSAIPIDFITEASD